MGETEVIRALFEKAISLTLPPRKMKVIIQFFPTFVCHLICRIKLSCAIFLQFIFKKYLEYEKSCGDEDRVEYVKKRAMEYVESG